MFPSPDAAVLAVWGQIAIHTPAIGNVPTEVKLIKDQEANYEIAPGVLMVLFGTADVSGFVAMPVKGDTIEWEGGTYRVYDVKGDWSGGTPGAGGLWLHLTK